MKRIQTTKAERQRKHETFVVAPSQDDLIMVRVVVYEVGQSDIPDEPPAASDSCAKPIDGGSERKTE